MNWHDRFVIQAAWTRDLRKYIFTHFFPSTCKNILEVGCGTGVIINEIISLMQCNIFGIDLNTDFINFGKVNINLSNLITGDGYDLPFSSKFFDITLCHFLLLWVDKPIDILKEMKRVTKPEGLILALAEPDYGGRIDFPENLAPMGLLQKNALENQGADTEIGRKLRALYTNAGINIEEIGVLGGRWSNNSLNEVSSEWRTLEHDLINVIEADSFIDYQLSDMEAWRNGTRILFVPTFYAIGKVAE